MGTQQKNPASISTDFRQDKIGADALQESLVAYHAIGGFSSHQGGAKLAGWDIEDLKANTLE